MDRALMRSLLFVPGNQTEKLEKAWSARPDGVILDLEDGVVQAQKSAARQSASNALSGLPFPSPPVLVRINSGFADLEQDLNAAVHPTVLGILLPKCESKT